MQRTIKFKKNTGSSELNTSDNNYNHTEEFPYNGHHWCVEKCPLYGHTCFIEIPLENEYLAEI